MAGRESEATAGRWVFEKFWGAEGRFWPSYDFGWGSAEQACWALGDGEYVPLYFSIAASVWTPSLC